jgi:hypothetical protein
MQSGLEVDVNDQNPKHSELLEKNDFTFVSYWNETNLQQ